MRILAALISFLVAAAATLLPLSLPTDAWGTAPELVVVAVLCAVMVALLPRVAVDATPLLSTVIGALSAGAALAVVATASESRPFQHWILVPAVATLVAFLAQLLRGTGASARTDSLSTSLATALLGASGSGWFVAWQADAGAMGLIVAVVGVLIGTAASLALAARGMRTQDAQMPDAAVPASRGALTARWILGGGAGIVAAGAPVAMVITVLQDRLS
ncbi:MAG: hypothetical protein ACTIJJ_09885 [Galactobacter sp.]|uniref:hypothetical protein n=1 Tax=Galactobacter sp. TaxID=2676125 RepID=UPI0025C04270|nr:hypothetical protein [Galactobacter sp.]